MPWRARLRARLRAHLRAHRKRKNTADDVRESVNSWKEEAKADEGTTLERAYKNREKAQTARDGAADGKIELVKANAEFAANKKAVFAAVQSERQQADWNEKLEAKEVHLKGLQDRFVDPDTSAIVESSTYELVSTAHRTGVNGSQASQGGSTVSGAGRSAWSPSAKSSGWFADWWSGPELQSTVI